MDGVRGDGGVVWGTHVAIVEVVGVGFQRFRVVWRENQVKVWAFYYISSELVI